MDTGRGIELFGVFSILMFGAVVGGSLTYTQMDARMDSLENQVQRLDSQASTKIIYANSTGESLTGLYKDVNNGVVSVTTFGPSNSEGSGFVYSKKGYIVTNQHVVEGATRVRVEFSDGDVRKAEVIGSDPYTDLAVLKVDKKGLNPLELGNSSNTDIGEMSVAIGSPYGLQSSMTKGIISQKGRVLPVEGGFSIPNVLQTDAAINPGNSGGPLLNKEGEVVGVNTAIQSSTRSFSGVGFAIPSKTVKRVVPELIQKGEYKHPYIGVRGLNVNPSIAEEMNLENETGFLVTEVPENTGADRAGIRGGQRTGKVLGQNLKLGGDVIVGINGTEVKNLQDVLTYLAREAEVGDRIDVEVIRDGRRKTLSLVLEPRPES
ncbi:MAG: S1C family serine protease [Candidatus Nanohalobium sp.]